MYLRLVDLLPRVPPDLKCKRLVSEGPRAPYVHCFFGVPPKHGRMPLDDVIPVATEAISFLGEVDDEAALIRSFLESYHAQNVLLFEIGSSSYANKVSLDYRSSVAALDGATLPRLERLVLGEWELFHNAATLYGTIGDVTDILARHERLKELMLYGTFDATKTMAFPRLEYLELWSSSSITDPNGAPIDPPSFANVLASDMPKVTKAVLHPHCEPARSRDAFPAEFLDGRSMPALSRLEVVGDYMDGEALGVLMDSALFDRPGVNVIIEEVEDSPAVQEVRARHAKRDGVDWPFEDDWTLHTIRVRR